MAGAPFLTRRDLIFMTTAAGACAVERRAGLPDATTVDATDVGPAPEDHLAPTDHVDVIDARDIVDATPPRDTIDVSEPRDVITRSDSVDASDAVDAADVGDAVDAVDAADVVDVFDAGPPCGLSDRFRASLPLASLPAEGAVLDGDIRVVIARDARGVYAFSAVCPHNGCVVEVTRGAATHCPCHGSTFNEDGVVQSGPAQRSLLNHPVVICEGRVYVNRSTSVPTGSRTPVT